MNGGTGMGSALEKRGLFDSSPELEPHAPSNSVSTDDASSHGRKRRRMESAVRELLECLGEDPEREGLVDTPKRMAKALLDCTAGYHQSPSEVVGDALFTVEDGCGDMVVVKDIPVHSLCEHHMVPFHGKAHVAYIPDGKVIGLSKIGRIVEMFARRLQVQERLTQQVANAMMEQLAPKGVGVVIECSHMCMSMRGVRQPSASTRTRALLGCMKDADMRADFMRMLSSES
eukprot:CAMPEP_0185196978 /NCGR_PEP_ID=MMETSP1140-20130426/39232_1 /TAXON_ID=298111 /ORGANISM="Pavlova sp., Strain CCMP459" /LENGTH=229 /DNA_ID=CAMNT_0027764057 /DNA_START=12 /DNA_END=701 /DNA_ORIENTATION=+